MLKKDIAALRGGGALLLETTVAGWGDGAICCAPIEIGMARRLGPDATYQHEHDQA